jgi:hypothetical protein
MTELMNKGFSGADAIISAPGQGIWNATKGTANFVTDQSQKLGRLDPFAPDPEKALQRQVQEMNVESAQQFWESGALDKARASMIAQQPEAAARSLNLATPQARREILAVLPEDIRNRLIRESPEVNEALGLGGRTFVDPSPGSPKARDLKENEIFLGSVGAKRGARTTEDIAESVIATPAPVEVDPGAYRKSLDEYNSEKLSYDKKFKDLQDEINENKKNLAKAKGGEETTKYKLKLEILRREKAFLGPAPTPPSKPTATAPAVATPTPRIQSAPPIESIQKSIDDIEIRLREARNAKATKDELAEIRAELKEEKDLLKTMGDAEEWTVGDARIQRIGKTFRAQDPEGGWQSFTTMDEAESFVRSNVETPAKAPKKGGKVKVGNEQRLVYNTVTDEVSVEEYIPRRLVKGQGVEEGTGAWKKTKTLSASRMNSIAKIEGWLGEDPLRQAVQESLPTMMPGFSKQASRDLLSNWADRLGQMRSEDIGKTGLTPEAATAHPPGYTLLGVDKDAGLHVIQNDLDQSIEIQQYLGKGEWKTLETMSVDDLTSRAGMGAADTDRLYTGTGALANNFVTTVRSKNPDAYVNIYNRVKNSVGRQLMTYGKSGAKVEHAVFELLYASDIIKAARAEGIELPDWVLRFGKKIQTKGGKAQVLETPEKWLEEVAFLGRPAKSVEGTMQAAFRRGANPENDWTTMTAQEFSKNAPELHAEALTAFKAVKGADQKRSILSPKQAADALGMSTDELWERWVREFDPSTITVPAEGLTGIQPWTMRRTFDKARLQIAEAYLGKELSETQVSDLANMRRIEGVASHAASPIDESADDVLLRQKELRATELAGQQARLQTQAIPSNAETAAALEPQEIVTETSGVGRDARLTDQIAGEGTRPGSGLVDRLRGLTTRSDIDLQTQTISNVRVAPISTTDLNFHLYLESQTDPATWDFMNKLVDDEGRRVWQVYLDIHNQGGTKEEAVEEVAKLLGITKAEQPRLWKEVTRGSSAFYRDALMYNIASGPVKGWVDAFTDLTIQAIKGHPDAAWAQLKMMHGSSAGYLRAITSTDPAVRAAAKEGMIKPLADTVEAFDSFTGIHTGERMAHLHYHKMGEEAASQRIAKGATEGDLYVTTPERLFERIGNYGGEGVGKAAKLVASTAIANSAMRTWRVMIDDTKRALLFQFEYVRFHPEAVDELIARARAAAPKLGMSATEAEDAIRQLRVVDVDPRHVARMDELFPGFNTFTSDQLEAALGGVGEAKNLARFWKGQQRRLKSRAVKSVEEIMFSYMPTRLDSQLQRVIFFHYWTSRALALQAKIYFENPLVAANFTRLFEGLKRETERNPERPWYLKYTAEIVSGPYGMAAMFSPVAMIVPLSFAMDFSGMMEPKNRDNFYKQISQFAFIHPWLQTAASLYGLNDQIPDVTGTGAFRRKTIAFFNILKASGHVPHSYDVTDDVFADNTMQLINWARSVAGEAAIGRPSRTEYDRRRIKYFMVEIMREQGMDPTGPEADLIWSDFQEGTSGSDIYKEAYTRFATGLAAGEVMREFIPFTATFPPQDETNYLSGQIGDVLDAGGTPTPEMLEARDIQTIGNAPSGDASKLTIILRQVERIGTPDIKETYDGYNDFAYKNYDQLVEIYGEDTIVHMPGQDFSLVEWSEKPQAERQLWLDEWVDVIGYTRKLHAYRMALTALETQEPLYKEYKDYQSYVQDLGTPQEAMQTLMDASPAFRSYIEQQTGDYDLTKTLFGPDAFLAQRGTEPTIYENMPAQAFDASSVSAVEGLSGGGGGGEESFFTKSWDEMTSDEKVASLTKDIRDYNLAEARWNDALAKVIPAGTDPSWWGAPSAGQPASQWFEATIGGQLTAAGFSPPSIPKWVESYMAWIPIAMSQGIEATPASYVKWWEAQYGASPLSAPESAALEPQYAGA